MTGCAHLPSALDYLKPAWLDETGRTKLSAFSFQLESGAPLLQTGGANIQRGSGGCQATKEHKAKNSTLQDLIRTHHTILDEFAKPTYLNHDDAPLMTP